MRQIFLKWIFLIKIIDFIVEKRLKKRQKLPEKTAGIVFAFKLCRIFVFISNRILNILRTLFSKY